MTDKSIAEPKATEAPKAANAMKGEMKSPQEATRKMHYQIEVNQTPIPELPEELKTDSDNVYKWLRVILDGKWDNKNITSRMRDGWEWVHKTDHPSLELFPSFADGDFAEVVGVDDLALARLPRWLNDKRRQLQEKRSKELLQAVHNQLDRDFDARSPLINESRTQVSRGRPAHFDD